MTWKFHVLASAERRLFSRILQVLESQLVAIHSFAGDEDGTVIRVTTVFSSEQDKAYRIEALLYRLQGIQHISVSLES